MIIENLISFLYTCLDFATTDMAIEPRISCRKLPRNRLGRIPNRVHRLGALYKSFAGTGDCACCSYKKKKEPCGNLVEITGKSKPKKKKKKRARRLSGRKLQGQTVFLIGLDLE